MEEPTTWASPVVVIPKQDGDIRICIDMRKANSAIKREVYPLPTFHDIISDLRNGKYFSKLDIKSAFHQIELNPESRVITTFITHKGLYHYK